MTNIMELRKRIAEGTGIPVEMVTGECPGDMVSRAKALVMAKRYGNMPAVASFEQCEKVFKAKTGLETKGTPAGALEFLNKIQLEIAAADPIQGARCDATQIYNRNDGKFYAVPEIAQPRAMEIS